MPLSSKRIKSLRSLQLKKYRDLDNRYVVEGIRLLEEALASPVTIQEILISEDEPSPRLQQILQLAGSRSIAIHKIPPRLLASLCDTETPQGVLAVVEKSSIIQPCWAELEEPLLLILDQLHDPGNLGTILRTAEWFGVQTVLLSQHTVELYNPKVVRSSMGALFRLRCISGVDLVQVLPHLQQAKYAIVTTVLQNGEPAFAPLPKTALVIGGEAEGVSSHVLNVSDRFVTIPRRGRGESLNAAVATGIVLDRLTSHRQL
jgi:TrmH family RNA methyltransferase